MESQNAVNLVDHLEAVDVRAGREEEEIQVAFGNLTGINGKAAVVTQVINVGWLTGQVLDEESVTVARVGLLTVLGIGGNLYPGQISQALAGGSPHAVVA